MTLKWEKSKLTLFLIRSSSSQSSSHLRKSFQSGAPNLGAGVVDHRHYLGEARFEERQEGRPSVLGDFADGGARLLLLLGERIFDMDLYGTKAHLDKRLPPNNMHSSS